MASKFIKTFSFVLYGIVTFLLLCAVLVLIFKDDKSSCSSPPLSSAELANLLNDTDTSASTVVGGGGAETTPAPQVEFTGTYELYSSENFDEFLTELGLGYFTRLAATKASSQYVITKTDDGTYTLRTISTFGESSISFKDGVEFSEDRLDGNTVRSVLNIKGNKWIQKQFSDAPEKEVTIVREWVDNGVKVTSVINGIASVRKYKKTG